MTEDTDDENANNARYNPTEVTDATYKQQRRFSQNYNAGVNWKPFKNWTFRSEFGYGWRYNNTDQVWEYKATINSKFGYAGNPQAYLTNENSKNWRNANTITYDNKKLFNGRDRFNVLIGQEATSSQTNKISVTMQQPMRSWQIWQGEQRFLQVVVLESKII